MAIPRPHRQDSTGTGLGYQRVLSVHARSRTATRGWVGAGPLLPAGADSARLLGARSGVLWELENEGPDQYPARFAHLLLDGLSIQVALEDPEVDSDLAYDIAMRFAERELNLAARNNLPVRAVKRR